MQRQGLDYSFQGKHIEGFVVEDSNNFMFKIKLPYYSFWKQMRALKDRIIKNRLQKSPKPYESTSPEEDAFYQWAIKQPEEMLLKDIY